MKIFINDSSADPTFAAFKESLTNVGFDFDSDSSEVELYYLESKQADIKISDSKPSLIFGPGIVDYLKKQKEIDFKSVIPEHELRVRPQLLNQRHRNDFYLKDELIIFNLLSEEFQIGATANYQLTDYPIALYSEKRNLFILNLQKLENFENQSLAKFLKVWLKENLESYKEPELRVGLLAYGAIGHEHNRAVSGVPGFKLAAVCDSNPARIQVAKELSPNIEGFLDADKLLDSDIDLVVISTPPNSHFSWAKKALEKNKHVVLEKPMSLTVAECDELITLANQKQKTLVVYQNRRWDQDFLTLEKLVESKEVGEVFHVEIFVGGYGHPCNYWHSDEKVSGGAIFDWGAHFLDQALGLFGKEITYLTAKEHKIHWLDVTNSDHSRVTLNYKNGLEVEFIYSDLAAALKPKYYLLGTLGAIQGNWRVEKVTNRNEIGTLLEDELAPADSPAEIEVHDQSGSVKKVKLETPPSFQFHRELADWINFQIPMTVNAQTSRDVVAIMQAASESAAGGGLPVKPLL